MPKMTLDVTGTIEIETSKVLSEDELQEVVEYLSFRWASTKSVRLGSFDVFGFGVDRCDLIAYSTEEIRKCVLTRCYNRAREIVESSFLNWETKYDLLFGEVAVELKKHDIFLNYYDPDTTYESDSMAFFEALQNAVRE